MKIKFLHVMVLALALFLSDSSEAAKKTQKVKGTKINCQDFAKEADQHKANVSKKQKELENIEKQLQSNTKAIEEYNKNCRMSSKPNCNPAMYNIITGQTSNLNGQQQKLMTEIMDEKSKQEAAIESQQSCKEAVKKRKI